MGQAGYLGVIEVIRQGKTLKAFKTGDLLSLTIDIAGIARLDAQLLGGLSRGHRILDGETSLIKSGEIGVVQLGPFQEFSVAVLAG